jgi:predicted transcriptional regulator
MTDNTRTILNLTAEIVSAHIGYNHVPANALPALIEEVYRTLAGIVTGPIEPSAPFGTQEGPQPAVPINRSVFADYIVCLEDGAKLKMLKRHLQTAYNVTPAAYRERWRLPADYPMVAPSYARTRSRLAKAMGLGQKNRPAKAEEGRTRTAVTHLPARRAKGSRG